jgi:hypothetical protein
MTQPLVQSAKIVYWQDADNCPEDGGQELVVHTEDGGGGPYIVIATQRWAIDVDEVDNVPELLRRVLEIHEGEL